MNEDTPIVIVSTAKEVVTPSVIDMTVKNQKRSPLEDTNILGSFPPLSTPITTTAGNTPAFSDDGLSSIATKLGTPLMLDSYTSNMCMKSQGRSSYARVMIELRADVELKDKIVMAMPRIREEGHYLCNNISANEKKTVKKPSQNSRGLLVGPKMGFKPQKEYRPISKKRNASSSGNKKKGVKPTIEVSNLNPFDILNSVDTPLDNDGNPLVLTGIVESDSEVAVVFDETANLRIPTGGELPKLFLMGWTMAGAKRHSESECSRRSTPFVEYGLFKDFMTRRVLLRCDSTGDLYPVTKPSTISYAFLTSQYTWHQCLGHPGSEVLRYLLSNNSISCTKEKPLVFSMLGKHMRFSFVSFDTEITQEILNATFSVIFLYKTPNQAYQLLEDKVLLKLDWDKNKKIKSSLKKTIAFTNEGKSNTKTDKIMARIDVMTIKMDAQYRELQSQAKQLKPDLDDDDMPMSREEEAKFMQTFHKTRFYNDYRDRDSNRDNWRSSGWNAYHQDNYRSNTDDKPYDL
nr:ribonuclease H-like domain-containing protein [Tanacetum cinerariifolium]